MLFVSQIYLSLKALDSLMEWLSLNGRISIMNVLDQAQTQVISSLQAWITTQKKTKTIEFYIAWSHGLGLCMLGINTEPV